MGKTNQYQFPSGLTKIAFCGEENCAVCRGRGISLHSTKGPAVIYLDKRKPDEYWFHGEPMSKFEWLLKVDMGFLDLCEYIRTEREREGERKSVIENINNET